jgi:hypothetical protein
MTLSLSLLSWHYREMALNFFFACLLCLAAHKHTHTHTHKTLFGIDKDGHETTRRKLIQGVLVFSVG